MDLNQFGQSIFKEGQKQIFKEKCFELLNFDDSFYVLLDLAQNIKEVSCLNDPNTKYFL